MLNTDEHPVVIIGGGPIGLFLAICLQKTGIRCIVLEKRASIDRESKSIGIHPVSLELFEELGISGEFLHSGVKIRTGDAFIGRRQIGSLSFSFCPSPFPYILSLPQYETERILKKRLEEMEPGCFHAAASAVRLLPGKDHVTVFYTSDSEEQKQKITARWVAGCDGNQSFVRESAGISVTGGSYPDCYMMADLPETTDELKGLNIEEGREKGGSLSVTRNAAVYLHPEGVVESFPLPGQRRRWVVKTDRYIQHPTADLLQEEIRQRIGVDIPAGPGDSASSFGVHQRIATTFRKGRILLAGDAAHVVSPIGGQGMNLGFLTANLLASALEEVCIYPQRSADSLNRYSAQARHLAFQVARRAEWNMMMGRKHRFPQLRSWLMSMLLSTQAQPLLSQFFTMRGLGRWPI